MTTKSEPDQPSQLSQPSQPTNPYTPAPTPTIESIFVISYDRSTGLSDADKTAAEALLGKVVWFEVSSGARMPQVTVFARESR